MKVEHRLAAHVVVVGASSGIGLSLVNHLLDAGYVVTAISRKQLPQSATDHPNLACIAFESVRDVDELVKSVKVRCREIGGLDGLVLNSGVIAVQPISFVSRESLMEMVEVNLLFHVGLVRGLLSNLIKRKGSIVYVSSSAVKFASEGRAAYSASKAAAEAYFLTLGRELGRAGVRSNVVRPGLTETQLMAASTSDEGKQSYLDCSALGRLLRPDEVAKTIRWLISSESDGVTCQKISVDGGGRI